MVQLAMPTPVPAERGEDAWLEPGFFKAFKCIGAACEDTCCEGWGVPVDRNTYEKYQNVSAGELGVKLKQLVTIKDAASDSAYAAIQLNGSRCSFLADGLCTIHAQLGEEYLSHTCATFPRVLNSFGHRRERSLDLSCPEAARLALLNERPMEFCEGLGSDGPNTQVRRLILQLVQDRRRPVSKRLILVGNVCDKWTEFEAAGASELARLSFLENFALAVKANLFDAHLQQRTANPAAQLSLVLDLLVARMRLDYTPPRYLDLYREVVSGLDLEVGSTPEAFGAKYFAAYRDYYAPFMETHEYMLEQYLVAYAFKTMLPYGAPPVNRILNLAHPADRFAVQYMLMASYFSIAKAVMIGLAGEHKSSFGEEHVVRSIQTISRTLEHCETYPARLLEILAGQGIRNAAGMDVLTQNRSTSF